MSSLAGVSGTKGGRTEDVAFRRLLANLPAAAYTCDSDGLISYFNSHAASLWGRKPRLNHPEDRYCGSFQLFTAEGQPIAHDKCWMALALKNDCEYNGQEILIERADGTRCTALANASPIHDADGRVTGAVTVLVDISDRKRMELALREADRRKSDFLAMLAHELRSPLAPIRNGLKIVRLAGHDAQAVDDARNMVERQAERMVRLIDDLFDLSRINSGKVELRKQRLEIADAVQDAVELCQPVIEEAGHELILDLPREAVPVDGDRDRLAQVFANLLNNSAKFTPPPGKINLAVERQGSEVLVTVKDNGIGIPPNMLSRIFDMFMQVDHSLDESQEGLGIGLNLVRGLVERHGGRVEVHSDGPGKGAELIVRLPVAMASMCEPQLDDYASEHAQCSSHYRILVVDDNRDSALSMAMLLKIMGHSTRAAHDGLEAIEVAESFRPQIVLLDIGLPKLNGYEVCRRIRELPWGQNIVFIAQTGRGQDDDILRSKEAGFTFHMVKPFDPTALEKLLADLLLTPA